MPTITRFARSSRPRAASPTSRSSLRGCLRLGRSKRPDGRLSPRCEVALPATDVDPLPKLKTDAALDPRQSEPQFLVKCHAREVGQGNPGDDGHEALPLKQVDMRGQQKLA